jgi:hypothetical protein
LCDGIGKQGEARPYSLTFLMRKMRVGV